jgi:hypothetical protein
VIDAAEHLVRRFVREGDGEDVRRPHAELADEIRDAIGDDAGLAGARAGEDEQGAVSVGDRFALLGIEAGEIEHLERGV